MQHNVDNHHDIYDIDFVIFVDVCIFEEEHLDFFVEDVVNTQSCIGHVHYPVAIGIAK